jgi:hypothetical protein
MDLCVMCGSKVQQTENWIRCHLWGGFAIFTGDVSATTCAPRARNGSRARSGKPVVTVNTMDQTSAFGSDKGSSVMSLNRATVIGNLGADPELRHLPSGQPAVGFSIATDESFTDKEGHKQQRVEWHQIVAFGKLAETCSQYLKKGRQVYVEAVFALASSMQRTTAASANAPRSWPGESSFSAHRRRKRLRQPRSKSQCHRWTKRRSKRNRCGWAFARGLARTCLCVGFPAVRFRPYFARQSPIINPPGTSQLA